MKYSKELKTGSIAVVALALLIAGINFLKGNSFFGGDDVYYVYFSESGGITGATSVYVNGVIVGKVVEVRLSGDKNPDKKVLMTFNIQDRNFKIPTNSVLYTGNADLLSKGIIIIPNEKSTSYHKPKDYIQGQMGLGMLSELREIADPLMQKVQALASTMNHFVESLSSYWDTTANMELTTLFSGVHNAMKKFETVATHLDDLMIDERDKLGRILTNVESITSNLHKNNAQIANLLNNMEGLSADLLNANVDETVQNARTAIAKFDTALDQTLKGEGTLGKLIADDQLYNELNTTNQQLQNLIEDVEKHPERYIRVSVFGGKVKGTNLSASEERKLKQLLDSLPDRK